MATEPYAEPTLPGTIPAGEGGPAPGDASIEGRSPWYLAYRRLRRNKVALGFGALFIVIVLACSAAGIWANDFAHTGPDDEHLNGSIVIDGHKTPIVSAPTLGHLGTTLLGPGLHAKFLLGADQNGRDVMVRLLYGGRVSLYIGVMAALVTTILAVALGVLAGYRRGWVDAVISRILDVIWAFPVLLLGIALGTAIATSGSGLSIVVPFTSIHIATLQSGSLWIPILIIGFVYIPYMARPIRGEVLALREKEFVEAAVAQGMGPLRIMVSEILPNLVSTIIVFFTLNIANNILLESALSFLGAGVQPPQSSWGTMIASGSDLITTAPWLTIIPGLAIVLTVLSLNVFGDGLRDALDPRAKLRLEAAAVEDR
jgi:peptide/nickel transport system permease protein